jgi:hypothetical protein
LVVARDFRAAWRKFLEHVKEPYRSKFNDEIAVKPMGDAREYTTNTAAAIRSRMPIRQGATASAVLNRRDVVPFAAATFTRIDLPHS